jgi:hypothetical protein
MYDVYPEYSWKERIAYALKLNGENWADVKHTPFNEKALSMSFDPRDEEKHYVPPAEAAWTEKYVYTIWFDADEGYYLIMPYLRNPPASL